MSQSQKFMHVISKGSRYNQIYIPKESESFFEAGDLVEVRLIRKKESLYCHNASLSRFKKNIILEILKILEKNSKIVQAFIFGSFLTKESDYNDIDILALSEEEIEDEISTLLTKNIQMKFHVITAKKENFQHSLKICPLTRSMIHSYASNKKFEIKNEKKIDKEHLKYLIMMPEDLLKIKLDQGRVYYDSLRKLVVIEHFLKNKEIAPNKIDNELIQLIGEKKFSLLKKNAYIEDNFLEELRLVIKNKLNFIYKFL